MHTSIYIPRALAPTTESVFEPHHSLNNDDGRTLSYPTASTHQTQNLEASVVQLLQKQKGNPVQEYTNWSIVYMKGEVIIYFPLVFRLQQPKFHFHMQLAHFKKNG